MIDHGILNLPLAKRGNLNAQIDAHKAAIQRELRQFAAGVPSDQCYCAAKALILSARSEA